MKRKPKECNILLSTASTPHLYTGRFVKEQKGSEEGEGRGGGMEEEGGNLFKHGASGINTLRHQSAAQGQDTLEDMDCPMRGDVFAHVTQSKAADWLFKSPCKFSGWLTHK